MIKKLGVFLSILIFLLSSFVVFNVHAYAEQSEVIYSDVLDDLSKDSSFNVDDFPVNNNDYSIKVIQIAESSDNELFIYIYQPSYYKKMLTASSINISTDIDNLNYNNYSLTLLNRNDVFCKYVVNDFNLIATEIRYYDISSVFRPFDVTIDKSADGNNIVDEVSYKVGQMWKVYGVNNETVYNCLNTEIIEITNKYLGMLRYFDGFKLYIDQCDSWYIAFDTDKNIDKLLEADVLYTVETYSYCSFKNKTTFSNKTSTSTTLYCTDVGGNSADGLFGKKYSWNRIESISNFIKNEDIKDDIKKNLYDKKWVLRFLETDFEQYTCHHYTTFPAMAWVGTTTNGSLVSEVSILRLKFENEGIVYNLGVVDNKLSTPPIPDNKNTFETTIINFNDLFDNVSNFFKVVKIILFVLLSIILFVIFMCFYSIFIKPTIKLIKRSIKKRN